MSLLTAGFFAVLLVSFGLVLLVARPTRSESLLERRLSTIARASLSEEPSAAAGRLMKSGVRGGRPGIAEILLRRKTARKLEALIVQSGGKTTLERLALMSLGCAVGGFLLAYSFVSLAAVEAVSAILFGTLPYLWLAHKRSKRLTKFNAGLSNAIDMMSNALRAGHSVVGAIGILAGQTEEPVASEFKEVFRQQNFGLPLREALMQLLDRVPSEDLRVVVTAILVQKDTGGNLGEILDRTVFVIRERVRIRGEIQVQTAQGRATGWILTLLPVVLLLAINVANPGYSKILFASPLGRKMIYAGVGLLAAGALAIRHLIHQIEV